MKRPKIQPPPLPNHTPESPSLRPENNLTSREESAVAIANLFYAIAAAAPGFGLTCKEAVSKRALREIAEQGIERVEGLLKEIEREVKKL